MPPASARSPAQREEQLRHTKKEVLQNSQLANYDDVITDALVDRAYFWTQTRKIRPRFSASRGIHQDDITRIIRDTIIVQKDAQKATNQILDLPGMKRYTERLSEDNKQHFIRHLRKYVNVYLPDCPFEVTTTNRYTIDTEEAKVTARKFVRKGELIKYLCGMHVPINLEEEKAIGVNQQFSIVVSSRKKTSSLFLGPARFANHDCDPNARLTTTGSNGMTVVAARDIPVGEEITVSYGADYFGSDNCECLCATCEHFVRNGWDPTMSQDQDDEEEEASEENSENGDDNNDENDVNNSSASNSLGLDPSFQSIKDILSGYQQRKVALVDFGKSDLERLHSIQKQLQDARQNLKKLELLEQAVELQIDKNSKDIAQVDNAISKAKLQLASAKKPGSVRSTPEVSSAIPKKLSRSSEPLRGSHLKQELRIEQVDNDKQLPASTPADQARDLGTVVSSSASTPLSSYDSLSSPPTSLSDRAIPSLEGDGQDAIKPEEPTTRLTRSSYVRSVPPRASAPPRVADEDIYALHPDARRPGDYRDACVLSSPCSRWVKCRICDEEFVHPDSYHLRWSCPRCERHSKLYGYQWPKTDKEGKHDAEERIQDHRMVNWLLPHEEAKMVKRGKKYQVIDLEVPGSSQEPEFKQPTSKEVESVSKRGRGRPRKRPLEEQEATESETSPRPEKTVKTARLLPKDKMANVANGNPKSARGKDAKVAEDIPSPNDSPPTIITPRRSMRDRQPTSEESFFRRSLRNKSSQNLGLTRFDPPLGASHAADEIATSNERAPLSSGQRSSSISNLSTISSNISEIFSVTHQSRNEAYPSTSPDTRQHVEVDKTELTHYATFKDSHGSSVAEPGIRALNGETESSSPEAPTGVWTRGYIARTVNAHNGGLRKPSSISKESPKDLSEARRGGQMDLKDNDLYNISSDEMNRAGNRPRKCSAPGYRFTDDLEAQAESVEKKPGELRPVNWDRFNSKRLERPSLPSTSPPRYYINLERQTPVRWTPS